MTWSPNFMSSLYTGMSKLMSGMLVVIAKHLQRLNP